MELSKIAVLGAGNVACAIAGYLTRKGYTVNLFNRRKERIVALRKLGGIETEGVVEGFCKFSLITTEIDKAIKDVDLIIIAVPAFAHQFMAEICAPYLQDDQIILLNPGHVFGALSFYTTIKKAGVKAKVHIAEAANSILLARLLSPTKVKILGPREILLAAFPAKHTERVIEVLSEAFEGRFKPAVSVLETSLTEIGAYIYHCPTFIFNFASIERGEAWDRSFRGTPVIARFVETMDQERINVANALGVKVMTYKEFLRREKGHTGETLMELISKVSWFPTGNPNHRFILEDIPYGACPIVSLGNQFNVPMPATKAVIDMASVLYQTDFWKEARTVEKLGLSELSADEIRQLVTEGEL